MALVTLTRLLPESTKSKFAVNTDNVLWTQPRTPDTTLLELISGPTIVVEGKFDEITAKLTGGST